METKTRYFRHSGVLLWLLFTAFSCDNKNTPALEKTNYKCYLQATEGKARVIGQMEVTGRVFKSDDCSYCPQSHFLRIEEELLSDLETKGLSEWPSDGNTGFDWPGTWIYRCSGDPYTDKDNFDGTKGIKISGIFYVQEYNGRKVVFYDEGEGKPAYTVVK